MWKKMYSFEALIFFFIAINVVLSAWSQLHGDILFHTDIARDFLLFEDILVTHKPALIGPRSGGIPGVFHGPLWLYVNLPVFFLGGMNPSIVGWFWVALSIVFLGLVYFVAKRLFDHKTALVSVLLVSAITIPDIRSMFNPFGAVMLAPLFFYLFYKYSQNVNIKYLIASILTLGFIIQFQIAFGLPVLALAGLYSLMIIYKHRKPLHILAFLSLAFPLCTYVAFEIRHNFLQVNSLISYVTNKTTNVEFNLLTFLVTRFRGLFSEGYAMVPYPYMWFGLIISLLFVLTVYKLYREGNKDMKIYVLFFYFYLGFWFITFLFKGVIWPYYYWPFMGIAAILFVRTYAYWGKKVIPIIALIFLLNFTNGIRTVVSSQNFMKQDGGSWLFNKNMAQDVYTDAGAEFGYYIYTPDQYGYTQRYAMNYMQKSNPTKKAFPYQKKAVTYLIIAPPPTDRPDLASDWWKENQVKISKKPQKVIQYKNGIKVEKYLLTPEELAITSDPNLINTLIFR